DHAARRVGVRAAYFSNSNVTDTLDRIEMRPSAIVSEISLPPDARSTRRSGSSLDSGSIPSHPNSSNTTTALQEGQEGQEGQVGQVGQKRRATRPDPFHSARRAGVGSTRVARRAGT